MQWATQHVFCTLSPNISQDFMFLIPAWNKQNIFFRFLSCCVICSPAVSIVLLPNITLSTPQWRFDAVESIAFAVNVRNVVQIFVFCPFPFFRYFSAQSKTIECLQQWICKFTGLRQKSGAVLLYSFYFYFSQNTYKTQLVCPSIHFLLKRHFLWYQRNE